MHNSRQCTKLLEFCLSKDVQQPLPPPKKNTKKPPKNLFQSPSSGESLTSFITIYFFVKEKKKDYYYTSLCRDILLEIIVVFDMNCTCLIFEFQCNINLTAPFDFYTLMKPLNLKRQFQFVHLMYCTDVNRHWKPLLTGFNEVILMVLGHTCNTCVGGWEWGGD